MSWRGVEERPVFFDNTRGLTVEGLRKALAKVSASMRILGCLCILGMALVTVGDIVGRLNRSPIFGSEEIVTFLAVLGLGLSLPYGHEHRVHIGVEVFVQLLSTKTRTHLKILTEAVAVVFFTVVTVMMAAFGYDKQKSGEVSMNLSLPEHYIVYILAACFGIATLLMTADLLKRVQKWRQS